MATETAAPAGPDLPDRRVTEREARFSPGLMAGGRPQPKRKTTLSGGATLRKRLLIVRDACLSSPGNRRASPVTVSSVPSRSCSAAAIFVLMGLRVVISLS